MQHAVVLFTQPSGFSSDPSGSDSSPGISGIHFGGVPTSVHTDKCFHLLNFKCLQNPSDWALFLRQRWGKHCFKSLLQREMGKQYTACWLSYTLVTGRSMWLLSSCEHNYSSHRLRGTATPQTFPESTRRNQRSANWCEALKALSHTKTDMMITPAHSPKGTSYV